MKCFCLQTHTIASFNQLCCSL